MKGRGTRIVAPALLGLLVVVTASCSGGTSGNPSDSPSSGGRPSSTAKLTILSPENGSVVHGPTVDLRLSLEGAQIVKRTSTDLTPNEGHVHVLLDGTLISMNYRLDDEIHDVAPGPHRIDVEFVATDHAPFDPRVTAATSFEVRS